jgi:hypothetical protein
LSLNFHRFLSSNLRGAILAAAIAGLAVSCGIKKENIPVVPAYAQAQSLNREELLARYRSMCQEPRALIVKSASLTFSAESTRSAQREKLPSADGILIVTRSGNLRLQILLPMIKTNALDVVARGDRFEIWYPRKKTLYRGKMGEEGIELPAVEEDAGDKAPRYNLSRLRPWHITQTFFHEIPAGNPTFLITQEDSPTERYYVLHILTAGPDGSAYIAQKLWIERAHLTVRKKVLFAEDGAPVSEITYRNYTAFGSGQFPADITLRRPMEGYEVQFKIRRMELDPAIQDRMFELTVPEDAKIEEIHP